MRLVALALALALLGGCAALEGPRISPEQREAYEGALESLDRDPSLAQQRLEQFLRRWPDSPLADDARMRLGEIALARGDADTALRHFDYVVRNFSSGDQIDLARLRAAQIRLERGDAPGAERLLEHVRLSRLSREEQRAGHRALVDAAPDDVTRLLRLASLRAFESDEDAIALTDVEIDQILLQLGSADLERAADQLADRVPAARVRLRAAEVALEGDDLSLAREQLERASQLSLAPAYVGRLQEAAERLEMREAGLAPEGEDLPTFSEAAVVGPPRTAGAAGTLGVVLPLSGDFADFGEESLRGILLATGVFDPAPDPATNVRVLIRDSRGRPERAAEAVRELAEHDQVSAIVGPLLADECEAAAAAAQRAGVPLLALTSREEIAASRSQVLRLRTRPKEEVATLVDHAVRELGARTFAILYPNDAYGLGLRDLFWDAVEEQGGAVVGVARYDPRATDFAEPIRRLVGYVLLSPEEQQALQKREQMLRRARRLPPEKGLALREQARALTGPEGEPLPPIVDFDALFIPESHEKVVLIAPQLAFHEALGPRLLGPSGWYHPDLVPIGRDHVEGALFTAHYFPESELPFVREFTERYLETFAETPEAFAAQGYDAANLILVQLAKGRHSRDDVRRGVLATRAFPGVTGVLSMRADGNARKRPFLLGIERGHIVQLE